MVDEHLIVVLHLQCSNHNLIRTAKVGIGHTHSLDYDVGKPCSLESYSYEVCDVSFTMFYWAVFVKLNQSFTACLFKMKQQNQ